MNKETREAFLAIQDRRSRAGIRMATTVAILAFIGFAAIDPFLIKTSLLPVLGARIIIVLFLSVVIASTWVNHRYVNMLWLGAIWCLNVGGGVIAVTALTGGGESRYHDALAMTLVGYATIMRTTPWMMFIMSFVLIAGYDLVMVGLGINGPLSLFATNNAVLVLAGALSVTLVVLGNRLRLREFSLAFDLTAANLKMKSIDHSKNQFFANISHELRTPLTLIIASVEGLSEDEDSLTAQQRQQASICRRNSLRLLRLVDDILELTRLESDSLRLRPTLFDLAEMAQVLAEQVRPLAQRKKITVQCETPASGLAMLRADEGQIERIILNFVANAIKFTPISGNIVLRIALAEEGVVIEVEDDGEGIPQESLAFVFDRFYQVPKTSSERRSGVGIGLSLCKKLVELHQGRITAKSQLGHGTTMTVWLPFESQVEGAMVERRSDAAEPSIERRTVRGLPEWDNSLRNQNDYRLARVEEVTDRRLVPREVKTESSLSILVVDDNIDIVELLIGLLSADYEVYVARDGEEGLRSAHLYRPDLIISDVTMPKLGGFEFLAALREDAELHETPFMLLTARGDTQDRIAASKHGADGYLVKPFHPQELRTLVARLLQKQKAQAEALLNNRSLALRVMAEGIAHDVLNPLGFVRGALHILMSLIKEATALCDPSLPRLAAIGEEAQTFYRSGDEGLARVREAIEQLRRFSRSAEDAPLVAADVNESIRRVLFVAGVRSRVKSELGASRQVALRAGQLEQVLLNLIINAQQAGGENCEIKIVTWDESERRGVAIAICDNGPGMDRQVVNKIFDPYYTTKEMGTGLGLTVSREIVRKHGGTMTVASKLKEGTTFTISLPESGASVALESREEKAPERSKT